MLDVACGTGRLLDFIDPTYYLGVDASRGMLREAIRKHALNDTFNRNFVLGSAEELTQISSPGYYDIACSFWSFSYFRDPAAVLAGMHRALRRGGHVCVHAYAPRYSSRPSYILGDAPFNAFHPTEIELLMCGAGFRSIRKMPFRVLGDRLVSRLPQPALKRLVRWEMENLPVELGMTYVLIGVK